ncbi:sensor histidine kinase [Arenibaculum pallidiluteum]|uniref:sensor histidine kinase n=1 Tax=Arenibaculum pallidiluteum TaxID=2812559 RepID=UPI002E2DBE09|nr:sensor histidine kinase [Arenibaculum pallidiluteum]
MVNLKALLAACLGGIGLLFTVGTAMLIQAEATGRLHGQITAKLDALAQQVADKLDRGMFERWRDMQIAASLDTIRSPTASADARRAVVQRLQDTYPHYPWIGFITPDGILQASTGRVLEGANVSARGWWRNGLERPYVGDVHEAIVLAKILFPGDPEPPRFVDLAAPVTSETGEVIGVISAHLSWAWAAEIERSVLGEMDPAREIEAMILSTDGTIILGPRPLMGRKAADPAAAGSTGAATLVWPDGPEYLTSMASTRGYRDYPGLGWRVVVREPAELAMQPVSALRNRVLAWGAAVSLLAIGLGYLLAGWVARPLQAMARSVACAPLGTLPDLPAGRNYREIATLSNAIGRYAAGYQLADQELKTSLREKEILLEEKTALVHEINHRVKNNLQIMLSLARTEVRHLPEGDRGRRRIEALSSRIEAMGRLHERLFASGGLGRVDLADYLRALCDAIVAVNGRPGVTMTVEADPSPCRLDLAMPLGLLVNELVTNALKHAFPGQRPGRVTVSLRNEGQGMVLRIADDGIGCDGASPSGGIGSTLVRILARQVGGTVEFATSKGCIATVRLAAPGQAHPAGEYTAHNPVPA